MYQEFSLCSEKDFSVLENFVVFPKRLLCSRKNCCVLEKMVAFSKRLLCCRKDCCVSEEKLSCVLPLWATVVNNLHWSSVVFSVAIHPVVIQTIF